MDGEGKEVPRETARRVLQAAAVEAHGSAGMHVTHARVMGRADMVEWEGIRAMKEKEEKAEKENAQEEEEEEEGTQPHPPIPTFSFSLPTPLSFPPYECSMLLTDSAQIPPAQPFGPDYTSIPRPRSCIFRYGQGAAICHCFR